MFHPIAPSPSQPSPHPVAVARNSWSTYWGDGGFIKIARPGNICGVTDAPTVPQLV